VGLFAPTLITPEPGEVGRRAQLKKACSLLLSPSDPGGISKPGSVEKITLGGKLNHQFRRLVASGAVSQTERVHDPIIGLVDVRHGS
jgi:hypothetical protein